MMGIQRAPYFDRDPSGGFRWIVDRCPECGKRKRMRSTDDMCGACQEGEPPRMDQAQKPALDTLVNMAIASFGKAELAYLADRFREASGEAGGKARET